MGLPRCTQAGSHRECSSSEDGSSEDGRRLVKTRVSRHGRKRADHQLGQGGEGSHHNEVSKQKIPDYDPESLISCVFDRICEEPDFSGHRVFRIVYTR